MAPEEHQSCSKKCREEFRCSSFGFAYTCPAHFVTSHCGLFTMDYPIWTIFRLLYQLALITAMIVHDYTTDNLPYRDWHTYFTNWTYTIINIYIFWDFCVTMYMHISKSKLLKENTGKLPWYLIINWILFNAKNTLGVIVGVGYYAFNIFFGDIEFTIGSIEKHAIILVFILLDFFLCAKPVRLLHFYQPFPALLLYGLFSFLHQDVGNDPVYPVVDWSDSDIIIVAALGLLVVPVIHSMFFGLYHLRLCMSCCERRRVEPSFNLSEVV